MLGDLGCVTQDLAKKIPAKLAECSGIAPAPSDDDDQPAANVVGSKKVRQRCGAISKEDQAGSCSSQQ